MYEIFGTLKAKSNNVVGVGERADALVVLVEKKYPLEQLSAREVMPKEIDGIGVRVMEVGKIRAQALRTDEWSYPVPPGVSIGHEDITAGTFGCVVYSPELGAMILSNNHVLANSNDALPGDYIMQPGPYDGSGQLLAHLHKFVPINFPASEGTCDIAGGTAKAINVAAKVLGSKHRMQSIRISDEPNIMDAALAMPIYNYAITDSILGIGPVHVFRNAELGMNVQKSGRTTGITSGQVILLNATVQVGYGSGLTATFRDQIIFSAMSAGGDSGSLICTVEEHPMAVALLFAGSEQVTIGSPIMPVLETFEVIL